MNKSLCGFFGSVLIFAFLVIGAAGTAKAEVNVNINIGPPVLVAEPQELVLTPLGFYYVAGISYDVFFYNGYWWSPRGDRWYRAGQYNGTWVVVQRNYVPGQLFKVPKNYRVIWKNQPHKKYQQWKSEYGQQKMKGGQMKMQGKKNEGRGRGH